MVEGGGDPDLWSCKGGRRVEDFVLTSSVRMLTSYARVVTKGRCSQRCPITNVGAICRDEDVQWRYVLPIVAFEVIPVLVRQVLQSSCLE